MSRAIQVGDVVRLDNTNDPKWDGLLCTVFALTDYGAVLQHRYFRPGKDEGPGVATYRAMAHEYRHVARVTAKVYQASDSRESGNGQSVPKANGAAKGPAARDMGFTGDICANCQGSRMRRNGACLLCSDCGSTSGCS